MLLSVISIKFDELFILIEDILFMLRILEFCVLSRFNSPCDDRDRSVIKESSSSILLLFFFFLYISLSTLFETKLLVRLVFGPFSVFSLAFSNFFKRFLSLLSFSSFCFLSFSKGRSSNMLI